MRMSDGPVHLQYGLDVACLPDLAETVPEDPMEEDVPSAENNQLASFETTSDPACVTCPDCKTSRIYMDFGFEVIAQAA